MCTRPPVLYIVVALSLLFKEYSTNVSPCSLQVSGEGDLDVSVLGDLHEVNVLERQCKPIYWTGRQSSALPYGGKYVWDKSLHCICTLNWTTKLEKYGVLYNAGVYN